MGVGEGGTHEYCSRENKHARQDHCGYAFEQTPFERGKGHGDTLLKVRTVCPLTSRRVEQVPCIRIALQRAQRHGIIIPCMQTLASARR